MAGEVEDKPIVAVVKVYVAEDVPVLSPLKREFTDADAAFKNAQSSAVTAHAVSKPDGGVVFIPAHQVLYVDVELVEK